MKRDGNRRLERIDSMKEREQEQVREQVREEIREEVPSREQILVMRNIMDNQLETSDDIEIGRVADIEAELRPDGRLVLTRLMTGPEALAGRISSRLRPIVHFLLRNRFEHGIPIDDLDGFHPTLRLRGRAIDYSTGESERWLANHIFRWLPGSGWKEWHEQLEQSGTGTAETEAATETRTEETRAPGDAARGNPAVASHQSEHHSH